MVLDHEYGPDTVKLLGGISESIVSLWAELIKWSESVRLGNWKDKDQIEWCADEAMNVWASLFGACEIFSVMLECPNSILESMLEGMALTTTAREMDDAYHLLRERIKEEKEVEDLEQNALIHKTQEAILRFRLALRLAGVRLELQPLVQALREGTVYRG